MNLDQAWKKYLDDIEEVRQMFLNEPVIKEHPETEAAAINLLHQVIAHAYNTILAPRQDYPVFFQQHVADPYVYLAHLPNPDFVHRHLWLNGARSWRIWGKRNSSYWIDVQVHTGFWGEEGYAGHENYDFDEFGFEPDGSFEIIASAEPYSGNWIKLYPQSPNNTFMVRQATYDWENEIPIQFNVAPLDDRGTMPIVPDGDEIIRRLDLAGRSLKHSTKLWSAQGTRRLLRHVAMHEFVFRRGDGGRGSNQLAQYAQAVFELDEDEALIIEATVPRAKYWGIQLGNWWWETLDYSRHKSSINGFQATVDRDGKFRAVLSCRDPGVPNWLDPVGWKVGIILLRWYQADSELDAAAISTRKVSLTEVRRYLPSETAIVTPEQRRDELARRHIANLRRNGY